jgi:hypothetical protein
MNYRFLRFGVCLLLLPFSLAASAVPLLNASQFATLDALCSGGGALSVSSKQLLLFNTNGTVPAAQDALPADFRADSADSFGLVLCLTETEQVLETCQYSIFFSLPRVRVDHVLQLRAAHNPAAILYDTVLPGGEPAACDQAGRVSSQSRQLRGAPPDAAQLQAAVNTVLLASDDDNDGLGSMQTGASERSLQQ